MIKANDSHLRDLDRLRVLRKVELALVLPAGVLVPLARGEVAGLLGDLAFIGQESRVVQALPYAVSAIIGILESLVEVAAVVIHVVRQGICLSIVLRMCRDFSSHNSLPYHRQFRPSSFQDLVVMLRQVVVVRTIARGSYSLYFRAVPVPSGSLSAEWLRLVSVGGSQWQSGRQPQQVDVAANSAGSSRQHNHASQGRKAQGRGDHASRGRGGRQQAHGRINNFTLQDAQNHPDLIMGTLNVLGHFARVLIDCGATQSVISHTFAQLTQPQSTPLGYELEFPMPSGEKCSVSYVYPSCPVLIEDVVMPANLLPLDLADFDVILGADWLHYNYADIHCHEKTVTFRHPGLPGVTFVGERSGVRHGVISAMRAKKLLNIGCQGY